MTISLTGIPGIGPSTAKVLMESGFKSANEIAQASIAQLVGVPGFSTARASSTIKAASELLSASADTAHSTTQPTSPQRKTAKRPVPKSPSGTTVDNDTKEEQEKLEKAAAKKAKKAEKAATKKAKKAEKAAAKKAKKAEKAAAKKAKKAKASAKKSRK